MTTTSRSTRLSGLEPLLITPELLFVNVGERTNVTGSAQFRKLVREERYDEAVAVAIERTGCTLWLIVEVRRERAGSGKSAKAYAVDTSFRAACDGDIRFAREEKARRIADGLHPRCTCRHRRAEGTLEAVADRNLSGSEVDEKRRHGER